MKKILKSVAQFFLVWGLIGLFSYLSYSLICRAVIESYNKYGWQGALFAVLVEIVAYSLIYLLIRGVEKLIDFVTD
jgi:hypothetical protein